MQQFDLVCIPLAFRYPFDKMSFSSFVFTLFIIIFIHHDIIEKIIVKRANVFFFFSIENNITVPSKLRPRFIPLAKMRHRVTIEKNSLEREQWEKE